LAQRRNQVKVQKLFIGACLATCAMTAQAQSLVANGGFDIGDSVAVTTEYPGQVAASGLAGWDVLTGDGPVYAKQAAIGPSGAGDASLVVYDDGQQGGVSQTFLSDAPYLRVTADVFLQYGSVYLATTSPVGDLNTVDGTSNVNQWVTLTGVVPNVGAQYGQPNAVQIRSSAPDGSAFAVDNVMVEPVYEDEAGSYEVPNDVSGWQPPLSYGPTSFNPSDLPVYDPPASFTPSQVVEDSPESISDLTTMAANLRSLMSLYEMANSYGYAPPASYDVPYFPSVYAWP
jgi:hypothetical protein